MGAPPTLTIPDASGDGSAAQEQPQLLDTTDPQQLSASCKALGSALNSGTKGFTALNALDSVWSQVDADQYQTQCRAYMTAELCATVSQARDKATEVSNDIAQLSAQEAELTYKLQQQLLSNAATQKEVHRQLVELVESRQHLSGTRQAHSREARALLDESEWVSLQSEQAKEEREASAWRHKLVMLQEASAREIDTLETQLAARRVRAAHAHTQLRAAEDAVAAISDEISALHDALADAECEESLSLRYHAQQRTTLSGITATAAAGGGGGDTAGAPITSPAGNKARKSVTVSAGTDGGLNGGGVVVTHGSGGVTRVGGVTSEEEKRQMSLFGGFVKDDVPMSNLERLQLNVEQVAALPAAMRTAYLKTLSQHFTHLHNLNEHLKRVLQATGEFSRSHDLLDTLESIGTQSANLLDCHTGRVLVLDTNANVFRYLQVGQDGTRHEGRMRPEPGLVLAALSAGPDKIKIYRNIDAELSDQLPECDVYLNFPLHNCMIGCITSPSSPSTIMAVLQVFNKNKDEPFSEADYLSMRIMLQQAAQPIDNALAFDNLKRQDNDLDGLQDLANSMLCANSQSELVEILAVKGKKVMNAHRLMVTLLEIPMTQSAAEALPPVPSPTKSSTPHISGFAVTDDMMHETRTIEKRARMPRTSKSRRASFTLRQRPSQTQTQIQPTTTTTTAGVSYSGVTATNSSVDNDLMQVAGKLEGLTFNVNRADSREPDPARGTSDSSNDPTTNTTNTYNTTGHPALPTALQPADTPDTAAQTANNDLQTQQAQADTAGNAICAGEGSTGAHGSGDGAGGVGDMGGGSVSQSQGDTHQGHTNHGHTHHVSFPGTKEPGLDGADGEGGAAEGPRKEYSSSGKTGVISRPTSASAATRLASMGILLSGVEAVQLASRRSSYVEGADDDALDVDAGNLSAEELTKDATRSVRTDSKESGANKPTTGGGDTPGTPTSAAGKPLHSALKKGGKSNKGSKSDADSLSKPSLVFTQTNVMNPRQRRSSISAYTNYKQSIGMTPLVKEAMRRCGPVTRIEAHAEPAFDKHGDTASGFYSLRLLLVPLVSTVNGTLIGALQIIRGWPIALQPEHPWLDPSLDPFSPQDIATAQLLAEQAVVAYENVRMAEGVSALPQLLSDVPDELGLGEAAGRIMGAVMQVCPCEEVHILMRNLVTEGNEGEGNLYYQIQQGLEDPSMKILHPIEGIMEASFTQGQITQAMISDPGSAPRVLVGEIQEPWEPRDTGYTSQGQPDPPHLPQGYKTLLCIPVYDPTLTNPSSAPTAAGGQRSARAPSTRTMSYVGSHAPGSLSPTRVGTANKDTPHQSTNGQGGSSQGTVVAVIQLVNRMQRNHFDRCDMVLLKGLAAQASVLLASAGLQADLRALQQTQNSLLAFLRDMSTHTDITSATPAFTAWINGALAQLTECDTAGVLWVDAARSTLVYWSAEQGCFVDMDEDTCPDEPIKSGATVMLTALRFDPHGGSPMATPLVDKSHMTSTAAIYVPILSTLRMPPQPKPRTSQRNSAHSPLARSFGGALLRLTGYYGVVYAGRVAPEGQVQVPDFSDMDVQVFWQAAQHIATWIDGTQGLDLSATQA